MIYLKSLIYNILFFLTTIRTISQKKLFNNFRQNLFFLDIEEKISFETYKRYNIFGEIKSNFRKYYSNYIFKKPYYIYFNKLILVGKVKRAPIYLTTKYQPLLETTNNSYYCLKNSGAIIEIYKSIFIKKKRLTNIISISGTMTNNAYHWYTEYLPRLQIIYKKLLNENYFLLLDSSLNSFQFESLKLLSIPENKIIIWDGKPSIVLNCIIPSLRHEVLLKNRFDIHSRISYEWVMSKINLSLKNTNKQNYNLIISRNDVDSRRLVNQDLLKEKLKYYNFKIFNLSDHNQNEIISYFKNAKIIIGVHGAAFTYTMFCSQAKIIEIFPNNYKEKGNKKSTHDCLNSFFQISAYQNNHHYVYVSESISGNKFNIKINLQNFLDFFNKNIL